MAAPVYSNRGTFSVSRSTNHLLIAVVTLGPGISIGVAEPEDFYKAGAFRLGRGGFYYAVRYLDGPQIIMDTSGNIDSLGYSLSPGTSVTITESVS